MLQNNASSSMADSLYGTLLQGIMVVVFIKQCTRLSNDEYNYDSLQARHRGNQPFWTNQIYLPSAHRP